MKDPSNNCQNLALLPHVSPQHGKRGNSTERFDRPREHDELDMLDTRDSRNVDGRGGGIRLLVFGFGFGSGLGLGPGLGLGLGLG